MTERSGTWRMLWASGLLGRFVLICVGIWLHAADTYVVATLVPDIIDDIGGVPYVAWTVALYQIGAVVAGAAAAMLCVRFGLKRVMTTVSLIFALGCGLAAMAPNMETLLVARLVQGIGGGMLVSLSYVAIQQSFDETLWSRLFGVASVIWGAGSLFGPLIGGLFAGVGGWRLVFWFFAAQALALWAVAVTLLPATKGVRAPASSWPVAPIAMLTAATLMIAFAGVAGTPFLAAMLWVGGMGLLLAAAVLDHRSSARLLPAEALSLRHPVGAGLAMLFLLSVATTGFWSYGPLVLKVMFGIDPIISGLILAGESLAWSFGTIAVSSAPIAADRRLIRLGVVLIAIGTAGFAVVVPLGSLVGIVACSILQGAGFGIGWPSIIHRIVRFAGTTEKSLAAAAPGTVQRIGYAVGAAMCGIAANTSGLAEGISVAAAQTAGFWVFAAFVPILGIGLVVAWRFTRDAIEDRPSP